MLDELFKRFVKEKTFLANVSPKTVRFYQQSYRAFKRTVGDQMSEQLPSRFLLNDFVIGLREKGMSPGESMSTSEGLIRFCPGYGKAI